MTTNTDSIGAHENGAGNILSTGKHEWHTSTETGISFKPGTPEDYWLDRTKEAIAGFEGTRDLHLRAMFYVGDCLNFGEKAFAERYAQAIDATRKTIRLSMKTLQNVAWICGSIAAEDRHEMLTLSHHEAVAKLAPEFQKEFLNLAESDELSVADLKKKIKERFPGKKKPAKKIAKKVVIDMEDEKSVMFAAEKIAEFFGGETCGKVEEMPSERQKEWSGRILAIVEGFEGANHDNLFQRLAIILGAYLDRVEETEPLRSWADKRKEKWTAGMNALARAGRRMGVIGSAKPHQKKANGDDAE